MMPSRSFLLLLVPAFAAAVTAGCNIVGPAFYFIHGPEKTKKIYKLDKERTAVIFIDDRANRIPRRATRVAMGEEAEGMLLKDRAVKDLVSTQSALVAAGKDAGGQPVSIAEVGRAVQAEIVIYATIDDFHLTADGQSFNPGASFRVKVVDAVKDVRLWPDKADGYPVVVRTTPRTTDPPSSTAARFAAEDELARQCGRELAWLFVTHETPKGIKTPD
jgi:hypothetical protein